MQPLNVWIGVVQLARPSTRSGARPGMDCGRRPYRRRKRSAQVEESDGLMEGKDDEPGSAARSINASRGLKGLGYTGVHVRCTVENRAASFGRNAVRIQQMVIPASIDRTDSAELVPARRMRARSEVDSRERGFGWKDEGLRGDLAKRGNARRFRELCHVSGAR